MSTVQHVYIGRDGWTITISAHTSWWGLIKSIIAVGHLSVMIKLNNNCYKSYFITSLTER